MLSSLNCHCLFVCVFSFLKRIECAFQSDINFPSKDFLSVFTSGGVTPSLRIINSTFSGIFHFHLKLVITFTLFCDILFTRSILFLIWCGFKKKKREKEIASPIILHLYILKLNNNVMRFALNSHIFKKKWREEKIYMVVCHLPTYLLFPVLFTLFCRYKLPSGVISFSLEELLLALASMLSG